MRTLRLVLWTSVVLLIAGGSAMAQDAALAAPAEPAAAEAASAAEAAPAEAVPAEAPAPAEVAATAEPAPEPVASSAPTSGEIAAAAEDAAEEEECVFGKVCLGPVLTLGLANPLGIGVHARIDEQWGVGLDYQFLPSLSIGDASAGISLFTLDGRWYPGGSNFFLSLGFAYQSFYADASTSVMTAAGPVPMTVEGSVGVPAIKFGLGVMGGDGFVMGIDLALEVPLGSASVDITSDVQGPAGSEDVAEVQAELNSLETDIEDAGDTLVNMLPVLFQVNLIRIGYMF